MINKNILPAHWEVKKLGDSAKFIDYRGRTPKKTSSGIPLITAKNVKMGYINEEPREFIAEDDYQSWMTRGIPNEGDVLFTTEAPLGNVARLKTSARIALAQRMITFQAYGFLNSSFLHYSLMSPQFQKALNSKATGTTVKGIKAANLKQLEIIVPPLPEQQEIVAKIEELFSELDKGKEQLETALKQLKVYRQAVLKWAFEGRFTNAEVKNGELPKGWKWVTTGKVIKTINNGYTPKKEFLSEGNGEVPFIKVYNLNFDGTLNSKKNPTFIPKAIHVKDLKRSICFPDDVLINIVGPPLGKVSIVSSEYPEWNINQAIVLFRPNENVISKYISYFLQNPVTINWLENTSKATAGQWNIKVTTCREIPFPLPPIEEQNQIVQEIESRLSVCDKVEETITKGIQQAETLRQSILKKAFEGKLVKAEKTVAEMA
ncbi:restriction endonuclease subunit S [Pontibacter chitinilyticus]|uniref:restriction endonuclease subunit S n=1 Tax=Pontibacter chitinilyticus TaxID=2674989 RepID=UPI00321B29BE